MQSTAPTFSVTMPPSAERTNIGSSHDEGNRGHGLRPSNTGEADMLASSADLFSFLANGANSNIQPKYEDGTVPLNANPYLVENGLVLQHNAGDVENLGAAAALKPSRPSSAGPLRHRRGQQDRQLSIVSYASNNSSADAQGEAMDSTDSFGNKTTASSDQRTVKVGDHSFVIPLSSPVIPPQLQANVRMTSTGRPSHARKVPDDHVKVSSRSFLQHVPPCN